MAEFGDWKKLEIKIGKVVEVTEHPDADRLYVVKVDIGEKTIQLVAGIKGHYSIDELGGKQVVVLTNLDPKPLRGVDSQGMILVAKSQDKLKLLVPDGEIDIGSVIS